MQQSSIDMNESPASDHPRARTTAGVLLLLVGCLLSSARLIQKSPNPGHLQADEISQKAEYRFSALRADLPATGVIGYVGESGNEGTEDYYLAQYALAPLVVERSPDHPLVLGSFPNFQPVLPEDLQTEKDFGNGVLLLSHKDAK